MSLCLAVDKKDHILFVYIIFYLCILVKGIISLYCRLSFFDVIYIHNEIVDSEFNFELNVRYNWIFEILFIDIKVIFLTLLHINSKSESLY